MYQKITEIISVVASNAISRWSIWLLFAFLFYRAGETFTVWVLEPDQIRSGTQWLWILVFPLLVPAFFIVNRRFGCASGSCAVDIRDKAIRPPGH